MRPAASRGLRAEPHVITRTQAHAHMHTHISTLWLQTLNLGMCLHSLDKDMSLNWNSV